MKGITRRVRVFVVATLVSASLVAAGSFGAATAAANSVVHFRQTEAPFTTVWGSCGAIETVTITVHGTAFFDDNGTWVRTLRHFFYDSVVTGPSGESISLDGHQNLQITAAGVLTLTGQGANVRAPGLGLLYQDVGRLVVDVTVPFPGETLFASAHAVSFEPFDPDALGAAICAAVG